MTGPGKITTSRFRCVLTLCDEPACDAIAKVTITDADGESARACVTHAIRALDSITGARVDWQDTGTKTLNEFEVKALELSGTEAGR